MSLIKKGLILLPGIAIEVGVLWALCHFSGRRVRWNNASVYIVFSIGFLTAHWLLLWRKAMMRLFSRKKSETPTVANSPSSTPEKVNTVATPVPQTQPVQATPEAEATQPDVPPAPTPSPTPRVAPPMRMAIQNNAILSVTPTGQQNAAAAAPATQATPAASTVAPATTSQTSLKDKDILELADIDPDLDMMAFKHVALEGKIIDLVYSSDDVAVLCKLFSDEHTWTVDTTQPLEACTWTDETGAATQPCANLLKQAEALKKMEPAAQIYPTFVMVRGTIQNYQQVVDYLLQNKIDVVQYKNDSMPGVRDLHGLLKEHFTLFPEDELLNSDQPTEQPPQEGTQDG